MASMAGFIFRADRGADVLVRWVTLLAILASFFSWLSKHAKLGGDLTWPQAILLGIGLALAFALIASVALAIGAFAFRIFKPAPVVPVESDRPAPEQRLAMRISIIGACRGSVIGFRGQVGNFSDYVEAGASFMGIRRHLNPAFLEEFEYARHTEADTNSGAKLPRLATRYLEEVDIVAERWGIE